MADSGYKSISRIDIPHKKTHGWYVRVWYKGKMHSKFFSDKSYNSADEALEAAVEHRNEVEIKIGKPRTDRVVVTHSPRNKTGVVGVRRIKKRTGAYFPITNEPRYSEVFEVTWQHAPNIVRNTSFSIEKHGEKEAFRLACELRHKKERELYGTEINHRRRRGRPPKFGGLTKELYETETNDDAANDTQIEVEK
ncbi:AP2 domain-containing protein [Anaerolineales bacterium HSG6]|nr:AP2 domain-containing protein [Anaerolineales bacterium HSG6]MDM8531809.1 AP2 domain-containing protein [Anaerolineales bacterium HSG25]